MCIIFFVKIGGVLTLPHISPTVVSHLILSFSGFGENTT